jgi:large subunit ribosomal protein L13
MLPKNTFRDRRLARLKIFPAEAPEVYTGNVLKTWRDDAAAKVGAAAAAEAAAPAGAEAKA